MSPKETALRALRRLPDNVGYQEIANEIAFLAAISEAESDIKAGRVISHEEIRCRLESFDCGESTAISREEALASLREIAPD